MRQKDVKPSSIEQTEPDQQLVTTEVVEAVSSVLDQVKVVVIGREPLSFVILQP